MFKVDKQFFSNYLTVLIADTMKLHKGLHNRS